MAEELDYVPMPDAVVTDVEKMWSAGHQDRDELSRETEAGAPPSRSCLGLDGRMRFTEGCHSNGHGAPVAYPFPTSPRNGLIVPGYCAASASATAPSGS